MLSSIFPELLSLVDEIDYEGPTHRYGSYKLAKSIIHRMMSKKLIIENDDTMITINNVTSKEIDLLIFLCQICDQKGYIDELSYLEIKDYTNMCTKSIYNSLKGLKDKGYISYDAATYGYYNIQIIDNDFSDSSHDKKGYLNVNRDSFIKGTSSYATFFKLSVFEKKVYLFILVNYSRTYGYRAFIKSIGQMLGLKNKMLIESYLTSIIPLLGADYFEVKKSKQKYKRAERIMVINSNLSSFNSNSSIYHGQITYEKRELDRYIKSNSLEYVSIPGPSGVDITKDYYLNNLFTYFEIYKNLSYNYIKQVIEKVLVSYGKVGPAELKVIQLVLKNAVSKVNKQLCS